MFEPLRAPQEPVSESDSAARKRKKKRAARTQALSTFGTRRARLNSASLHFTSI
jgi:hypothetical protein